jgi:hypothetical protein
MPPKPTRLLTLTLPPILLGLGTYQTTQYLESRYPSLPPVQTSSLGLRTPRNPSTQHCPDVDIYAARIPLTHLHLPPDSPNDANKSKSSPQALQESWARAVVGSTILRTEGALAGFAASGRVDPGDVGSSVEGFAPEPEGKSGRRLLNGLMTVQRCPSPQAQDEEEGEGNGVLLSWELAPRLRSFVERLARWGYPWRFMSGGRHELSVVGPFDADKGEGEGPYVEVRFSSAHDYELVPEEGPVEQQKRIPGWTGRLHRLFARAVLDMAVRELRWENERRERNA